MTYNSRVVVAFDCEHADKVPRVFEMLHAMRRRWMDLSNVDLSEAFEAFGVDDTVEDEPEPKGANK